MNFMHPFSTTPSLPTPLNRGTSSSVYGQFSFGPELDDEYDDINNDLDNLQKILFDNCNDIKEENTNQQDNFFSCDHASPTTVVENSIDAILNINPGQNFNQTSNQEIKITENNTKSMNEGLGFRFDSTCRPTLQSHSSEGDNLRFPDDELMASLFDTCFPEQELASVNQTQKPTPGKFHNEFDVKLDHSEIFSVQPTVSPIGHNQDNFMTHHYVDSRDEQNQILIYKSDNMLSEKSGSNTSYSSSNYSVSESSFSASSPESTDRIIKPLPSTRRSKYPSAIRKDRKKATNRKAAANYREKLKKERERIAKQRKELENKTTELEQVNKVYHSNISLLLQQLTKAVNKNNST